MTTTDLTPRDKVGPDDWQNLEDLSDRRRVQNRLSQRSRRQRSNRREGVNNVAKQSKETNFLWVQPNTTTLRSKPPRKRRRTVCDEKPRAEPASEGIPADPLAPTADWQEFWEPSAGSNPEGGQQSRMYSFWKDDLIQSPSKQMDDPLSSNTTMLFNSPTTVNYPLTNPPTATDNLRSLSLPKPEQATPSMTSMLKNASFYHGSTSEDGAETPSSRKSQLDISDSESEEDGSDNNLFGYAALHVAARRGHLPIVKLLVERGVPVDQLSSDNQTALHLAVEEGHLDVSRYLLERGAAPHLPNKRGQTVLHIAAEQGDCAVVRLLFPYLPNLSVPNSNGHTAMHRAAAKGHADVVRLMLESGMDAHVKVGVPNSRPRGRPQSSAIL